MPSQPFVARYRSECVKECEVEIVPGDDVRMFTVHDPEAGWDGCGHDVCPAPRASDDDSNDICPTCFEVRAKNGECSC